ncbi:hypothetical protein MGG_16772 [Pyricularia oryzae 70-15]|uniref:Uncharacterized protein n=1 Tax=Pyricularia oryzae (strain 70-15 / ATCC MYA-4617 / FGSC 8958) TaxID=242507 RepID=G4N029_PYRO7|nr:uncharacterized protein MGG_16772 [Pyricularia oryzae 70-15]EHA52267.1 hypothetical protein MGG_16772 [Pyricularia oryzae 70-15]
MTDPLAFWQARDSTSAVLNHLTKETGGREDKGSWSGSGGGRMEPSTPGYQTC